MATVTSGTDASREQRQSWSLSKEDPCQRPRSSRVGMAALAAMFLLSLLPDWLFEGPQQRAVAPTRIT